MDIDKAIDNLLVAICILCLLFGIGKFVSKQTDLYRAKDIQQTNIKLELIKQHYNASEIKIIMGYYN